MLPLSADGIEHDTVELSRGVEDRQNPQESGNSKERLRSRIALGENDVVNLQKRHTRIEQVLHRQKLLTTFTLRATFNLTSFDFHL